MNERDLLAYPQESLTKNSEKVLLQAMVGELCTFDVALGELPISMLVAAFIGYKNAAGALPIRMAAAAGSASTPV